MVKALIAAGADPNLVGGNLLLTPLQEAAAHNRNPAVARALLDAEANVDARVLSADKGDSETFPLGRYIGHSNRIVNGMAALHLATMANSEAGMVDALLSSGADVAAKDARGRTPLHLAAMAASEAGVVDALVAAGAYVEAKDLWGRTPLHYALEANDNPDVAAALVRGGANVNAAEHGLSCGDPPSQSGAVREGTDDRFDVRRRWCGCQRDGRCRGHTAPLCRDVQR